MQQKCHTVELIINIGIALKKKEKTLATETCLKTNHIGLCLWHVSDQLGWSKQK